MEKMVKELKSEIVKFLLENDSSAEYISISSTGKKLTRKEIAKEVEEETEEGLLFVQKMITLAIDLFSRGKEQVDGFDKVKEEVKQDKSKTVFKHNCNHCHFLKHYEGQDLYWCDQFGADLWTVKSRYGHEPSQLDSGQIFATPEGNKFLYKAKLIAIEKGLVKNS